MKHRKEASAVAVRPSNGDMMGDITIRKTTALIIAGFVIAVLFGAYTVFSTPEPTGKGTGIGQNISNGSPNSGPQDIYIRALADGTYDKQEVSVKRGVPVRLHFTADPNAGCGRQMVLYGLNVNAISKSGEENVVEFTPNDAGTFEYNCGMRMWKPGKLIVV
jgi:heme/copper-type cytochrome/quinol oxidase subunit 2